MASESPATGPPRRRWWPFSSRKVVLVPTFLVAALALFFWYETASVPDVGEPFNVPAFTSLAVPDDQNAFVDYRLARHRLVPISATEIDDKSRKAAWDGIDATIHSGWPQSNTQARHWLDVNESALELWKRGTARPDALASPIDQPLPADDDLLQSSRENTRLGLMQAARVTAEKGPADAWDWYRAVLRSSRHLELHTGSIGRLIGGAIQGMSLEPILNWSSQAKLTAGDLRLALTDAQAIDAMTPPLSRTLKASYVESQQQMLVMTSGWTGVFFRAAGYRIRLRRDLNMVYANWLSQCDRPRFVRTPHTATKWLLFNIDPAAPSDPHVLPPAEIVKACRMTDGSLPSIVIGLQMPYIAALIDAVDREEARRSALILGLALELFHREQGHFPTRLDELVQAKILPAIPADPFGKGEPFHYRREADAKDGALLWSVWLDGIDQEGKIEADRQREGSAGDKIFRITSPRSTK